MWHKRVAEGSVATRKPILSRCGVRVAGTTVAAIGMVGGVALPASAASPATNAAAASIPCGWTPANNTRAQGTFWNNGTNIRTGPGVGCLQITAGNVGDHLVVHCGWFNNADGHWWDYLTDTTRGVTGWSRDDLVAWVGAGDHC